MRQILLFTSALFLTTTTIHAQRSDGFERDYQKVKTTLQSWDPIRGAWLAEALPAVVDQTAVPVRTFPENATPMDVMSLVPADTRNELLEVAEDNRGTGRDDQFWTQFNNIVQTSACDQLEATSINRRPVTRARTYGDPHIVTYDGERISFQAVGEFVLTKADDNRFEVQTRQRPVQDDFSVNTAVAMNMNGDRVCLYAEDFPDANTAMPLRVNGQPVQVTGNQYFLPNGGIVRRSGENYIFDWPTGESVNARSGRTNGTSFYNVSVNILPCGASNLTGVLGNADGNGRNDFDSDAWSTPGGIFASNSRNWERDRSAFAIRNLADQHRVTQATTLFDYGFGQSTFSFTDRSYPRVIRTVNDLDPVRRDRARRRCNDAGIRGADLNGCIYDNAYLNINPCPPAPVRPPVVTRDNITPIRTPVVNDNPPPVTPVTPIRNVGDPVGGVAPNRGGTRDLKGGDTKPAGTVETPSPAHPRTSVSTTKPKVEENPTTTISSSDKKPKKTRTWSSSSSPSSTPSSSETTPTRSTPTRTTTRSTTRSTPSRSTTTRSTTRSTPTRTSPSRSTPTRTSPTRTSPSRSTPTRTSPSRSTPTRSTPSRSTPTRTSPSRGRVGG